MSAVARSGIAGTAMSTSSSCELGSDIATRYAIGVDGADVVTPFGMAGQDSSVPARLVSVSVDLDAVACYYRIHALAGAPPDAARTVVLRRCLPRFAELFARHG